MTDTKNTEAPPAFEPPAPVETAAPVTVVRERGSWVTPLIAALVVVVTLVGGVGGFALAAATHAGGRPALHQGQFPGPAPDPGPRPGGPQQGPGGPQGGPQQGPGGPQGQGPNQPDLPAEESDGSDDDSSTEGDSAEG